MTKKQCLETIAGYFHLESCIAVLKNPDFGLKSHIFFFKDTFKEIKELKILKVISKNPLDNILFDIYYISEEFEGLFHGYFKIQPLTQPAYKMFTNLSKVCTDLGEYFYYVYQNSTFLKIYLIAGNTHTAIEQSQSKNYDNEYSTLKNKIYMDFANYSAAQLGNILLDKGFNRKYISNFIRFNSKCTEEVKMFLITILSSHFVKHICMITPSDIKNYISLGTNSITFKGNPNIPIYGLLEYGVSNNIILLLRLEYDFEGGVHIGKTID